MGQTIVQLAKRELAQNRIFPHRFCLELCECIHFHYRNVRINLTRDNWFQIAKGCKDSLDRWFKRGTPGFGQHHVELARKEIEAPRDEFMCVNLNRNLYNKYKGMIFSEGNEFDEDEYIHLKYRDIRIEMSKAEFKDFAEMIGEAYAKC